ncbi:MAG: hypothetical protein GXY50_02260 [Syntrophomonadaceae bacterium]|nr:hypothetical protein [Syntrophomonadaceae bacterium]
MKNSKIFPFERNKYYFGKLLSVEDFNLEQKYINDKRRMINRFVLGTGVVAGMYAVQIDERTISVERGFALDSLGREIVIDAPEIKKLSLIDGFDFCVRRGNDSYVYLCVEYNEVEKSPVHSVAGTNASGESFNKIQESYRLYLTNDEPENDIMAPSDLYEQKTTIYWDGKVRINQIMPRYVRAGQQFELRIEIENLDKQYVAFSYDLALTCLASDNQSVVKVSFDEILYEKTGNYTQVYQLEALQCMDVEGIAEVDLKSFQLSLGKVPQPLEGQGKSVTHITEKDTRQQLIASYYKSAMDEISTMINVENLYLAKIYLVKAGDTYLIENIENVPFGQFVMNNPLSAATQQLLAKNHGSMAAVSDGSIEAAATRAEKTSREIASGTCRIHFNAGGRKGERFFSDEIVHGLGLGSVTLILGVSQANSMTFGSMGVFEKEDPAAELAAKLNPAKGTFVIGARLIANTTIDAIDVKWTAIRDVEEIIEEKTKMKVFIKPNTLALKTRESYYLEAVCSNMQDKTIHWSVADNGGMIDKNGLYVAPNVPGVYEVVAQSAAYPEIKASIIIVVRD